MNLLAIAEVVAHRSQRLQPAIEARGVIPRSVAGDRAGPRIMINVSQRQDEAWDDQNMGCEKRR